MRLSTFSPIIAFSAIVNFLLSISGVSTLTAEQLQKVETHINTIFLPNGGVPVPGMSISIVHDDQLFSNGYGFRNIENSIRPDGDTLYGVGSISKMLSGMYITKLLNDKFPALGEGVLDVPVKQLAPNFNLVFNDRYRTEFVTFRDLLSHKVCVSGATDLMGLVGAIANTSEVVFLQRYAPQGCHFRHIQISYNNALIHVAGEAAASVNGDGTPFEDLLLAFLARIGMTSTRVIRESDNYNEIPNMSQPYYYRDGATKRFNANLLKRAGLIPGSGGVLTTANDMAKYMKFLINKGKVGETQVVSEVGDDMGAWDSYTIFDVIRWVTRVSTPYNFNSYKTDPSHRPVATIGYGITLEVGVYDGWQFLRHSGLNVPYTTGFTVFPGKNLGIFTSASGPGTGSNYGPNHYWIHHQVFEMALGNLKAFENPLNESIDELSIPAEVAEVDPGLFPTNFPQPDFMSTVIHLKRNNSRIDHSILVGKYGLPAAGDFEISNLNETTLYLTYGVWGRGPLLQRSETPTVYDAAIDTDLAHHFYASNQNLPAISIDFAIPSIALVNYGGTILPFSKDFSITQLPEKPWAGDTCGPN